jgi:hypothetical protein
MLRREVGTLSRSRAEAIAVIHPNPSHLLVAASDKILSVII